jgi:hypothetical protein
MRVGGCDGGGGVSMVVGVRLWWCGGSRGSGGWGLSDSEGW